MAEQGRAEVDSLDQLGTAAAPLSALLGKRRAVVGEQLDTGGNQHLRGPEGGSQSAEGRGQEQRLRLSRISSSAGIRRRSTSRDSSSCGSSGRHDSCSGSSRNGGL